MRESQRMLAVQSPIIPVVRDLIEAHPGTISLGQGVVSYGPPKEAVDRIANFASSLPNHKYQPVHGIPALIQAIREKLHIDNNITIGPESRIFVTAGANMAFMNVVLAIADPCDEFIIMKPYYFNYEMAIRIANCVPVEAPTTGDYQLDLDAIEGTTTDRTRAIVTISPNNPTGVVYPESSLQAVNRFCRERGLYHISDEAYEYFTYDGVRHFSPGSIPFSAEHTISIFSLSKSYGFASWRVGYMLLPSHLFEAVRKVQDTILICPPVISQEAAVGALAVGSAYCKEKLEGLAEVRRIIMRELERIKSFCHVPVPAGAFYFLLRLDTKLKDMDVIERLIRDFGVAVIPGNTFGMEDGCYLRVSYGPLEKATAIEGIGRLVRGLKAIASE